MRLFLCIPTYRRPDKLWALLMSIDNAIVPGTDVFVYYTPGDELTEKMIEKGQPAWLNYKPYHYEYHAGEFWNHAIHEDFTHDLFIYLSDDCIFYPDTLRALRTVYRCHFPHDDGVVGFVQKNLVDAGVHTCKAAFGAMGKNFIKMLNYKPFCPDYYTFYVDTELERTALQYNAFYYSTEVKVDHLHPAVTHKPDETNDWARRFASKDKQVFEERRRRGLIWGLDNTLVRGTL